jgi:hypothetical protein
LENKNADRKCTTTPYIANNGFGSKLENQAGEKKLFEIEETLKNINSKANRIHLLYLKCPQAIFSSRKSNKKNAGIRAIQKKPRIDVIESKRKSIDPEYFPCSKMSKVILNQNYKTCIALEYTINNCDS